MAYALGVDLGTTYTAAAIRRGDRLEIADLGTRTASMPSVVYLREDGQVLTGEAANRRGVTDPGRLSREFKRRMGDTTAILLGGVPYSVDGLMARVLQAVVATVTERQGEPPSSIAVAHPANWGPYKKDLLEQAVRRADLDHVTYITEPEAAAVHYATLERLDPGATVAVYDLGGGTFDAAVLRKTTTGFELIGEPEGIERLGGIDFDEAVFRHVLRALGGVVNELDQDDPVVQSAVSRLRDECVAAKEALSSDTEVSIPVILPNVHTDVRLTRAEFEAMIRPALSDTLVVLQRALRSAGVRPDDLYSVLLVGGSSRIPLIAQLVSAELGRPIAIDVHPKHSVALGAAVIAGDGAGRATPAVVVAASPTTPTTPAAGAPAGPIPTGPPGVAAPAGSSFAAPSPSAPPVQSSPTLPAAPAPPAAPTATGVTQAPPAPIPQPALAGTPPPRPGEAPTAGMTYEPPASAGDGGGSGGSRKGALIGAGVVVAIALAIGAALAFSGGGDDGAATGAEGGTQTVVTDAPATNTSDASATTTATTAAPDTTVERTTVAPTAAPSTTSTTEVPVCTGVGEPCIQLDTVRVGAGGAIEVSWTPFNFTPDIDDYHGHLYWNDVTAEQSGNNGVDGQREWDAHDDTIHTSGVLIIATKPPRATEVCITVGLAPAHNVPNPDIFDCEPLPA